MADEKYINSLAKLCRICGEILGKQAQLVAPKSSKINKTFFIDVCNDIPEIHPTYICLKCFTTVRNVESRETTTSLTATSWIAHHENCTVCYGKLKTGPKRKKRQPGRPSKDNKNTWTRSIINEFVNNIPLNNTTIINISAQTINRKYNSHLDLCICYICKNIVSQPVTLENCQHSFCLNCIVTRLEGKKETETCPKFSKVIHIGDVKYSKNVSDMIDCITIECGKKCGEIFKIKEYNEKIIHENKCDISSSTSTSLDSTKLSDIFSLDETSELSRDMEDAALHIIKHKMSTSKSNIVKFPSGGPRVSTMP